MCVCTSDPEGINTHTESSVGRPSGRFDWDCKFFLVEANYSHQHNRASSICGCEAGVQSSLPNPVDKLLGNDFAHPPRRRDLHILTLGIGYIKFNVRRNHLVLYC